MRAVVVHPANPDVIYAGGVAGGVFKTETGGDEPGSWVPLGDSMGNLAVNALAMDPFDPETLLAGTGEGYFNFDAVRGAGFFRTRDGGQTWTQTPTSSSCSFPYVNKIVHSPQYQGHVYAAVGYSSACATLPATGGVYRSTDGGDSWSRILEVETPGGCFDLALRNDSPEDVLFASCGTFSYGGNNRPASVYRTPARTATGNPSWSNLTDRPGFPKTHRKDLGRTSLGISSSPDAQQTIYALSADRRFQDFVALHRSTDGGETWTLRSDFKSPSPTRRLFTNVPYAEGCFGSPVLLNQGWYDNVIAVDPVDPNRVFVGGIDLFRSTDGGQTFGLASFWWADPAQASYAHADHHAIVFHPGYDGASNQTVFVGNDGGLFRMEQSASGGVVGGPGNLCEPAASGVVFSPLNHGLALTQFYDGAVYPNDTAYLGGTQDNGTVRGEDGYPEAWTRILGGDGGSVAVDPWNPQVLYAQNTGLSIRRSDDGGATWASRISGIVDAGFLFIAPFLMDPAAAGDPTAAQRLWTGGQYVWRTDNGGGLWTRASTALPAPVSAIGIDPRDPDFVIVGTAAGTLHRARNGTTTTPATNWKLSYPRPGWVSSIHVPGGTGTVTGRSPAYATYSSFGGGAHVWRSHEEGTFWDPRDGRWPNVLPDVPVHSLVSDRSGRLYVGTDLGVFVSLDDGQNWAVENTGFGHMVVEKLVISGANLYAFTHGRGVWRVPLRNQEQTALLEMVSSRSDVLEGAVHSVEVRLRTSDHAPLIAPAQASFRQVEGTAKVGVDYSYSGGTLEFGAGSPDGDTRVMAFTILQDEWGEPDETFRVELTSPSNALLSRWEHEVTIRDDGDLPAITIDDTFLTEGDSGSLTATFTLHLARPALPGTTVTYQTQDGLLKAPAGYVAIPPTTISIPAGATSRHLYVQVLGNTEADDGGDFFLKLTAATNATLEDDTGRAQVTNTDFVGFITPTSTTYTVSEGARVARIPLTRVSGQASVTVTPFVIPGSAGPGDFGTPVPARFPFRGHTATVLVPIVSDQEHEEPESLVLRLSQGHDVLLTILDDDPGGLVRLASSGASVKEGGTTALVVKRSGGAAGGVVVPYSVTGGTASSGTDHTLAAGSVTFGSGELSKTIPFEALDDGVPEGNETVEVTLGAVDGGGTLGTPSVSVVSILDAQSTFVFDQAAYSLSESQAGLLVAVKRTGDLKLPARVDYSTLDGAASSTGPEADFLAASGTLEFGPNVASRSFTLSLKPDQGYEPDETFALGLSNPQGGPVLGSPSTAVPVTIQNDDLPGTFAFQVSTASTTEPAGAVSPLALTVARSGGSALTCVQYEVAAGTAASPDDVEGGTGTLVFPAKANLARILLPINPDGLAEGDETFTVSLTAPCPGGALGANTSVVVTIRDDEPTVAFVGGAAVTEPREGVRQLLVPVKRWGPPGPVSVTFAPGGTATQGADYTLAPASSILDFSASDTIRNIEVSVASDALYEGSETITLSLASAVGAGLARPSTVEIALHDAQPVVRFLSATATVPEPKSSGGKVRLAVKRSGDLSGASTVPYAIEAGSATAGADFLPSGTPSPILFSAGQSAAFLEVPLLADPKPEPGETLTVSLSPPTGASLGVPSMATVTITDDDKGSTIGFAQDAHLVLQGAGAHLQIKREGNLSQAEQVVCATEGGTATPGEDYPATSQPIHFGMNQSSATCVIGSTSRHDDAPVETVEVVLKDPSYGVTLGPIARVVIHLVEAPPD